MLVGVVTDKTYDKVYQSVEHARKHADLIEWRLDFLKCIDLEKIRELRQACLLPIIFTLRPLTQGGQYRGPEDVRLSLIKKLVEIAPDYFDIEYNVSAGFLSELKSLHPKCKFILSYHDFNTTPQDLNALLEHITKTQADYYKIATMANSSLDVLRMLHCIKHRNVPLVAHCMGPLGVPSRILGKVMGSKLTYGAVHDAESVPGMLSLEELINTYHIKALNNKTVIYGLLGCPIEKSVGHIFHNKLFREEGRNAVYVKFQLNRQELTHFFELIKTLPFKGFSVTMPLKKDVMAFVHDIDKKAIGAINTIKIQQGKCYGTNTDGIGALDAIESKLTIKGKSLLILGAGGAARAIAFEAHRRGANITIINRTKENAAVFGGKCNAVVMDFNEFDKLESKFYDVVINTVPFAPEDKQPLTPSSTLVMDINYQNTTTPFLEKVNEYGCAIVPGLAMFEAQGELQQQCFNLDSATARTDFV